MSHCLPGPKNSKRLPQLLLLSLPVALLLLLFSGRCHCCYVILFIVSNAKKIVPKHYFYLKQNLWLWKLVELNGMGAIFSLSPYHFCWPSMKRICFNLDDPFGRLKRLCVILSFFFWYCMLFFFVFRIFKNNKKSLRKKNCSEKSLIFGTSNNDIFSTFIALLYV